MKRNRTSQVLIACFSALTILQSISVTAGENVVGYVLDARGSVAEQYPMGMPIVNKTKIDVSATSKLTVFHNKKCETIEITGTANTVFIRSYGKQLYLNIIAPTVDF